MSTSLAAGGMIGHHPVGVIPVGSALIWHVSPVPVPAFRARTGRPGGWRVFSGLVRRVRRIAQAGFASALAAWKSAAAAPAATMNTYLQQAADDLRTSGNSSYKTAITELTYLAHLPVTNDTPAQPATARSYVRALDGFFRTPGLMS